MTAISQNIPQLSIIKISLQITYVNFSLKYPRGQWVKTAILGHPNQHVLHDIDGTNICHVMTVGSSCRVCYTSVNMVSVEYWLWCHPVTLLTHWGRVTHIGVSKLTITGSDNHNGLSPGRCQTIIWTNDGFLLIQTLGTNFTELLSEIHTFSFKKMHLEMSAKWRPFCSSLNMLTWQWTH